MKSNPDAAARFREACRIANRGNCFIVEKPGLFLVYRKVTPANIKVGKAATLDELLKVVNKVCICEKAAV